MTAAEDPLFAYTDMDGRVVLVTDKEAIDDRTGKLAPVVVVCDVEQKAVINKKWYKANRDITVYARSQVIENINNAIKNGGILYATKKGSQALSGVEGTQFPNSLDSISFEDNINNFMGKVKMSQGIKLKSSETKTKTPMQIAMEKAKMNRNSIKNIDTSSYTEKQKKSFDYNQKQTEVGHALKTLNDSRIGRSTKFGVGKDIGGGIYVHKDYASEVVPKNAWTKAQETLKTERPDFKYNAVMYDVKNGTVRFDEAPDFDTAREPITGDYITVSPYTGKIVKEGHTDYIWHHKWEWVKNDYKGFDVEESWNWSKEWLSTLKEPSDGNGIARWNAQLDKYGLPHDAARYSTKDILRQEHTSADTSINSSKIPSLYTNKNAVFVDGGINIDIGAGKFDTATDYLESKGVTSLPFDPFNRKKSVNLKVLDFLRNGNKADTATCSNVLNVIDTAEGRANVILEMAKAIKPEGVAYFTVYENKANLEAGKAGQSKNKPDQWQEFRATKTYVDEVKQYFNDVSEPKGGLIIARDPKQNLPKAIWQLSDKRGTVGETTDEFVRFSTKNSKGEELSEGQVNYFKDSKARDEQGNLLVMYHGTDHYKEITQFKNGRNGLLGPGIYFSSDEATAKRYATQSGGDGQLYAMYVDIKNPLIVTSASPATEILGEKVAKKRAAKNSYESKWLTRADINKLKAQGYDGIIWKYGKSPVEISVWDSSQVKRTDNINPTGNKDVRYSTKGELPQDEDIKAVREKLEELQKKYDKISKKTPSQIYQNKIAAKYEKKYKEKIEKLDNRELREKIVAHTKELSAKLLHSTDKKNIPQQFRTTVAALLNAINQESTFDWKDTQGMKRAEKDKGISTKRTEAFRELRKQYIEVLNNEMLDWVLDPDLMNYISIVEGYGDIPLNRMNHEQLMFTWNTIKAVEASISSVNKLFKIGKSDTIKAVADDLYEDNAKKKERTQWNNDDVRGKILNWAERTMEIGMMTPQAAFHRLGETGDKIFRSLREAQDNHISILNDISEDVKRMLGEYDLEQLNEVHNFKGISLTTGQLMSLYELWKRDQSKAHILQGGIRAGETKTKGIKAISKANPTYITAEQLGEMFKTLTDEQKALADQIQKYLADDLSELGNEASMEVYGYRKFIEPNYFPIQTDKNQVNRDSAKETGVTTIASKGMTKAVIPFANNAVIINDILSVLSQHATDMSYYSAWLGISEDLRRILNYRYFNANPGSVRGLIERVMGKNAPEYFNKLLDDINQASKGDKSYGFDKFMGNYKAASVAGNIRVVIQQPTAILRAMAEIDSKYLMEGIRQKGNWEEVLEHSPIAIWKDWGNFDIGTGKQLEQIILGNDSKLEKVKEKTMEGASKADSFAWSRLWNAVKLEVEDKTDLEVGSDKYWEAVNKRFEEIIDKTQVVDGVLQRSALMRSKNALDKMATSFMAEPTKVFNMMSNAAYDYSQTKDKSKLKKVVFGVVTSFIVNAAMQSLIDAMRDDDKDKDYWEKFLESYLTNFASNFNPAGYIPYVKDVVSILQGYDVSRMDMDAIEKTVNATRYMYKVLVGEGKMTIANATLNLLAEASRLLGVPVANLKRDLIATLDTIGSLAGNYYMQYSLMKTLYNIKSDSARTLFYDMIFKAYSEDSNAYRRIRQDMISNGFTSKQIDNAIKNRIAK